MPSAVKMEFHTVLIFFWKWYFAFLEVISLSIVIMNFYLVPADEPWALCGTDCIALYIMVYV